MNPGSPLAEDWPSELRMNAWTGEESPVSAIEPKQAEKWVLRSAPPKARTFLAPPPPADPKDWSDARVGWGLILPHNPSLSTDELTKADDAPDAIRALVAKRIVNGKPAPVYRYKPGKHESHFLFHGSVPVPIGMAPHGIAKGALPQYLLIYGTPDQVPWELQYILNGVASVGRLSISGQQLENYVHAALTGWDGAKAKKNNTVIWTVDHGPDDITRLMRASIAEPVRKLFDADSDLAGNGDYIDGSVNKSATAKALLDSLTARNPGLIVTTSHGQTGPLNKIDEMRMNMGLLVDSSKKLVQPGDLLHSWKPSGAVWYAHACCSAGCDSTTQFDGLVPAGSPVDRTLKAIASVQAQVAPLPEALLGSSEPLRAFIGHVEPTFDWTLRQVLTGQFLTWPISNSLYNEFYQPGQTVGLAFRSLYGRLSGMYGVYDAESRKFTSGQDTRSAMLLSLLLIRDVKSMVILGDPAVVVQQT